MVNEANLKGMDLKQGIIGDMCLSSNLWGEYQKRYTGIHAFNPMGRIKPLTGVNLDEHEWCSLVQNFSVIKDCLNGKKVDLSKTTSMAVEVETVKTFIAEWVLNSDVLEDAVPPKEYYNRQDAVLDAHKRKPQPGNQFDEKVGKPEIQIHVTHQQPPEDTDLMYLVLLEIIEKKILDEAKANCEACGINPDSQFDHCESGNCLDEETNHVALYTAEPKNKVQVSDMMIVFDQVHEDLGLKPIFSKQLAKGALAWISVDEIQSKLQNLLEQHSPLVSTVTHVHHDAVEQMVIE